MSYVLMILPIIADQDSYRDTAAQIRGPRYAPLRV